MTTAPAIVKPMPRRAAAACGIWPTYCPPKPGAARSTTARSPIAGATRSQRSEPVEASAACNTCKNWMFFLATANAAVLFAAEVLILSIACRSARFRASPAAAITMFAVAIKFTNSKKRKLQSEPSTPLGLLSSVLFRIFYARGGL